MNSSTLSLPAVEAADDDMIWVIQTQQWIKLILLDMCWQWRNISYQTKTDLPAEEVADNDDMIYVTQKKQWIEMILLVWSEE